MPRRVRLAVCLAVPGVLAATAAIATSAPPIRVSHASSTTVQPQPAPGSCHARGLGLFTQPDPTCTPGALNPAVTQATIDSTICRSGYTKTIRPKESITNKEKLASMASYGYAGSPRPFEYDHLISLELGGAANDPRNLWPERGASPNPKDGLEDRLHAQVCKHTITLVRAQHEIARRWVQTYRRLFT